MAVAALGYFLRSRVRGKFNCYLRPACAAEIRRIPPVANTLDSNDRMVRRCLPFGRDLDQAQPVVAFWHCHFQT